MSDPVKEAVRAEQEAIIKEIETLIHKPRFLGDWTTYTETGNYVARRLITFIKERFDPPYVYCRSAQRSRS